MHDFTLEIVTHNKYTYHVASLFFMTVVDCGTLTNPTNGQVSHTGRTTFGQTATYSCDTGYILVGGNTRMCQATGVWSGSSPTCQSMLYQLLNFSAMWWICLYKKINKKKNESFLHISRHLNLYGIYSRRGSVAGPAGPVKAGPLFSRSLVSFPDCRDGLPTRWLGQVSHASSPLPGV